VRQEFLVADLAVTILVDVTYHLVDLIIAEFVTERGQDLANLGGGDLAVSVFVEVAELCSDCFFCRGSVRHGGHYHQEPRKLNPLVVLSSHLGR